MSVLRYDRVIEDMGQNLTVEWLYRRQIVAFRATNPSAETVDLWADTLINITQFWQHDHPYLCVNDASLLTFNTHTAQRIREVINTTPAHLVGRVATVLPRHPIAPFQRLYTTRLMRQHLPMIEYHTFTCYEGALAWLVEELRWGKTQAKFTLKPSA